MAQWTGLFLGLQKNAERLPECVPASDVVCYTATEKVALKTEFTELIEKEGISTVPVGEKMKVFTNGTSLCHIEDKWNEANSQSVLFQ